MSARRRFAMLAPCGVRPAGVMALTMALTAVQAQSPNGGQPLTSTAPKIGETTLGSVTTQHTISGGPAEVAAAVSPEPPSAAPVPIPAPAAHAVWQGNPIPVALKVDFVEISARGDNGDQLALALQVSGLVFNPKKKR